MHKIVSHLIPAENVNMGGIIVKQALPTQKVPQVDPYLLLHHGIFETRNDAPAKHQGIGPHPHRGFSPVTFVIEGEVHHRDSRGNNQIATQGEVQWMNAGAGIVHSERPSQDLVDREGHQEIIQLWINSPAAKKMKPAHYQFLDNDAKTTFSSSDTLITNNLITGNYQNLNGNLRGESELLIIWANGQTNGIENYQIPVGYNAMLYLIKGEISLKHYGIVGSQNLVVFSNEGSEIDVSIRENAQYLILSGKPLNEKMVQQGPFVMNSETEILEAMRDYQMGKMGILIEE
ncbi:MAG: pirin family protein [Bacteroidota bacterium]